MEGSHEPIEELDEDSVIPLSVRGPFQRGLAQELSSGVRFVQVLSYRGRLGERRSVWQFQDRCFCPFVELLVSPALLVTEPEQLERYLFVLIKDALLPHEQVESRRVRESAIIHS